MTTIRKLISAWMLAILGSLLLPLVSIAAVSGTTYDQPTTTTTAPAIVAQHTTVAETAYFDGTGLQSMASGHSRSLLGLNHFLNAPNNPLPKKVARVVPENVNAKTLGRPGADDVFVTAADDIQGLNAKQIADKLTIPESSSGFKVIEFDTPSGIASPINRTDPGFIGGGRTAGGAREFVVPNTKIPAGATTRTVR